MKNIAFIITFFLLPKGFCLAQDTTTFKDGVEELAKENYLEAQHIFQKEIEKRPSFSSFYNLGITCGKLNDWYQARWAFEKALCWQPSDANASFNAEFSTHQINQNEEWTHPFSWWKRIMGNFSEVTWLFISGVSSFLLSVFIFLLIIKKNQFHLKKWSKRLVFPVALLFIFACYGIYINESLLKNNHFAILKDGNTSFYISPNGVKLNEIVPYSRFEITDTNEDGTWLKIITPNENRLWVEKSEVYVY